MVAYSVSKVRKSGQQNGLVIGGVAGVGGGTLRYRLYSNKRRTQKSAAPQ